MTQGRQVGSQEEQNIRDRKVTQGHTLLVEVRWDKVLGCGTGSRVPKDGFHRDFWSSGQRLVVE